jgi:Protein of unknown function (DUF3429)
VQMSSTESIERSPGRLPQILGWMGVIPFAGLALVQVLGPVGLRPTAMIALVGYGAIILSFMGGAQWGLSVGRAPVDNGRDVRYAVSVVPALVGYAATFMPAKLALVMLIAGFAALLAYDLWTVRKHLAPAWYGTLRTHLSTAVIACLSIAVVP